MCIIYSRVCTFLILWLVLAQPSTVLAQQAIVEHFVGVEGGAGTRDGRGPEARFNGPRGVWSDNSNVYVADTSNATIRGVSLATGDVATIAGNPQQPPFAASPPYLIRGSGDSLYFANRSAIRHMNLSTGEISLLAESTMFRGPLAIAANSGRHLPPGSCRLCTIDLVLSCRHSKDLTHNRRDHNAARPSAPAWTGIRSNSVMGG
jgi:hypothetical protein